MTEVWPDFADEFSCKAGECRHSCCRGWEIDIDDDSFEYYSSLTDDFGKRIRDAVVTDEEGHHFRLDEEERCPFLLNSGLCDMILNLGGDSLCDICALHPRFFEDLGDLQLCGLGLSCEAVCELLLQSREPVCFSGMTMKELMDRLGASVPAERLHFVPRVQEEYYEDLLSCFSETEAIDDRWPMELEQLSRKLSAPREYALRYDPGVYDRIFHYILYRQLENTADFPMETILRYAEDSTGFVFLMDAAAGNTEEALRRWSEQIEYSTENVGILLKRRTES